MQVRTSLQHLWAELSEKIADEDPMIKYGGGDKKIVDFLAELSKLLADTESLETKSAELSPNDNISQELQEKLEKHRSGVIDLLKDIIVELESRGGLDAFLDSI